MTVRKENVCICDKCGHKWIAENRELPKQCPSRKCRSRQWNEKG
jgi:hypothetical protein